MFTAITLTEDMEKLGGVIQKCFGSAYSALRVSNNLLAFVGAKCKLYMHQQVLSAFSKLRCLSQQRHPVHHLPSVFRHELAIVLFDHPQRSTDVRGEHLRLNTAQQCFGNVVMPQ